MNRESPCRCQSAIAAEQFLESRRRLAAPVNYFEGPACLSAKIIRPTMTTNTMMPMMMNQVLTLLVFLEKAVFVSKPVGRAPLCSRSLRLTPRGMTSVASADFFGAAVGGG